MLRSWNLLNGEWDNITGWTPQRPWYLDDPKFQIELLRRQKKVTGKGINVAILDSCICPHTSIFGNRTPTGIPIGTSSSNCFHCAHGTIIAAIIGSPYIGIAPECNLINKVTSEYSIVDRTYVPDFEELKAQLENCFRENIVDIINISFTTKNDQQCMELRQLINDLVRKTERRVYIVSSAGNSPNIQTPALLKSVISVSASNNDHTADCWGRGKQLDIAAPSSGFAVPTDKLGANNNLRTSTSSVLADGTSFAAPFVSGVLALYLSSIPDRTKWPSIDELLVKIKSSAFNITGTCDNIEISSKLINPWKLITGLNPPT